MQPNGVSQPSASLSNATKNNKPPEDHMNNLIKIAVVLAFAAVSSGNLPKILNQVRKAQFQLIMESKASKWPRAMTLPSK